MLLVKAILLLSNSIILSMLDNTVTALIVVKIFF